MTRERTTANRQTFLLQGFPIVRDGVNLTVQVDADTPLNGQDFVAVGFLVAEIERLIAGGNEQPEVSHESA